MTLVWSWDKGPGIRRGEGRFGQMDACLCSDMANFSTAFKMIAPAPKTQYLAPGS